MIEQRKWTQLRGLLMAGAAVFALLSLAPAATAENGLDGGLARELFAGRVLGSGIGAEDGADEGGLAAAMTQGRGDSELAERRDAEESAPSSRFASAFDAVADNRAEHGLLGALLDNARLGQVDARASAADEDVTGEAPATAAALLGPGDAGVPQASESRPGAMALTEAAEGTDRIDAVAGSADRQEVGIDPAGDVPSRSESEALVANLGATETGIARDMPRHDAADAADAVPARGQAPGSLCLASSGCAGDDASEAESGTAPGAAASLGRDDVSAPRPASTARASAGALDVEARAGPAADRGMMRAAVEGRNAVPAPSGRAAPNQVAPAAGFPAPVSGTGFAEAIRGLGASEAAALQDRCRRVLSAPDLFSSETLTVCRLVFANLN